MILQNEKGNLMLMALMVFLVVSIMGTTLLTVAGLENKMVNNDNKTKQALLAADAGLEIARDVIIEKLKAKTPTNDIKALLQGYEGNIGTNLTTVIEKVDMDEFNSDGEITVTARGSYQDTSKKVTVTFKFENMPSEPIRADTLRVAGHYEEQIVQERFRWLPLGWELQTGYVPRGEVIVSGGPAAYNNIITNETVSSNHFTERIDLYIARTLLGWTGLVDIKRPPRVLNSQDFLTVASTAGSNTSTSFTYEDVEHFYELAQADPENWTVWNRNSFDFSRVDKPFNFVQANPVDMVNIEVRDNFWTRLSGRADPYRHGKNVVIVSNGVLNLKLNGDRIDLTEGSLYLLSPSGINVDNRYGLFNSENITFQNTNHSLTAYALTGQNLTLNSRIKNLYINGSLQARENLNIEIERATINWDISGYHGKVYLRGENNDTLIDNFPFRWSFLGVGKTIHYKQE